MKLYSIIFQNKKELSEILYYKYIFSNKSNKIISKIIKVNP